MADGKSLEDSGQGNGNEAWQIIRKHCRKNIEADISKQQEGKEIICLL